MKITEIRVDKQMKLGLQNYSNITASCGLTAEIAEGERVDWDTLWDAVNQQVSSQVTGLDPSWITSGETNKFFKVTMKIPKGGDNG